LISGTSTRHFAIGHPAAEGHFPGNPIIPGAVLLRDVVAAIGPARGGYEIRSAKFHQPIRPGDEVVIWWSGEARGEIRFSCSIAGAERPAVTGALRLVPP
jgi:3-hydroxymyristoyl/3-hydroxydecanoyl-(acyl carrier protein) dehydratase